MQQQETVSGNFDYLDHFGMPAGLFGQVGTLTGLTRVARENILVRWQEDIAKLASCPNIYTKISGLLCLY